MQQFIQFIILTFIYILTCFVAAPGFPAVVVAPDDGREDARNMLRCK
jgi:hypothetical protein